MSEQHMPHVNSINADGDDIINQVTEYGKFPVTEKLVLAVKSLQRVILYQDGVYIIPGKKKRKGKLNIKKFQSKFFPSVK